MQSKLTITTQEGTPVEDAASAFNDLAGRNENVSATCFVSHSPEFGKQNETFSCKEVENLTGYVASVIKWRRYPFIHILFETW